MSNNSLILSGFNNHFVEFIDDMLSIFPNNKDILTAKRSITQLRSINPKLIITFWKSYVVATYGSQIEAGDCDFFLKKDYRDDITALDGGASSSELMEVVERLRAPLSELSQENMSKCVKYIQNLAKLSMLYE
jgi:hypothetical protein